MPDVTDLRSTIIPRSDQLNSEQLLGGPMILTVSEVRAGGGEEQPVSIYYEADPGRPYKPCKTMRKVLILAWGADGTQWAGKSMELYCDPSVKFGGETVGGIRISRMTHIEKAIRVSLTATKGRKAMHEIGLLDASDDLKEVLSAIAAASDGPSMKKAKTLAEELTSASDIGLALTAYKKKVAELKARAAAPATPPPPPSKFDDEDVTKESILLRLSIAKNVEQVDFARSLIAQLPQVSDQAECHAAVTKQMAALGMDE